MVPGCDIIQSHKAQLHCLPSSIDKETMEYITSLRMNAHDRICNIFRGVTAHTG